MIHSYKFKNFFSFADWAEVSFVVNKQVPQSNLVFNTPEGIRISKLMTVIGANASGKTNVLKPLPFLSWFISNSFATLKPDQEIPVEPHFFSGDKNSEFEIEFEIDGELYRYHLVANEERVIEEALYIKSKKFFSYLFKRLWDDEESKYEVAQQKFGFTKKEAEKVRANASLISTAVQYDIPCAKKIVSYFKSGRFNVNYSGRAFLDSSVEIFSASEAFYKNPDIKDKMIKILRKLDLGISDLEIELEKFLDESGEEQKLYAPYGIHQLGKKKARLPLIFESSGTKRSYTLLEKILPPLKSGGVIVIDEMESDLHPDMLAPLLDLFISPETNPGNAQIIFTCHAHEVLNILDKSQVLLTEKNESGESEVWRLDSMKGVRRDENIYAKYRAGAYGAVPDF